MMILISALWSGISIDTGYIIRKNLQATYACSETQQCVQYSADTCFNLVLFDNIVQTKE